MLDALRRIGSQPRDPELKEPCGPGSNVRLHVEPCPAEPAVAPPVPSVSRNEAAPPLSVVKPRDVRGMNKDGGPRRRDKTTPPPDPQCVELARQVLGVLPVNRPLSLGFVGVDRAPVARILASLAVAWASTVGELIVVDADLADPTLGRRFGLPVSEGADLGSVLAGDALEPAVRATRVPALNVLPCHPGGLASNESWSRFAAVLDELQTRAAMVWIDLGAADSSAAAQWASFCDGVLALVTLGRTGRELAGREVKRLAAKDARILGTIAVQ